MASKSRGKTRSPSSLAVDNKSSRKSARFKDLKSTSKEEDKETSLAFKILSSSQTKEFLELETIDDVQMKMSEVMEISLHLIDMKDGALLDYYTGALWWGREQEFTVEQLSAFFTVMYTLMNNIKEKQMTLVENIKEFKGMMIGIGVVNSEMHGGLECFSVQQAKYISDYANQSIFQHYKMYEFLFSTTQAEEIIGTDLDVEVPLAADVPWPPPLEEAVDDRIYSEHISTATTPDPQDTETEGENKAAVGGKDADQDSGEAAEVELSQIETNLLNQLTPQEIKNIMSSVMEEMVRGLQTEVAQKLREKENNFLTRINKIHRVAETK